MTDTFFFFGCWNKDNCPDSCITDCAAPDCQLLNHRKMVLTSLATKSFNFGIIAGDNIYPVKKKTKAGKDKKYYLETLDRGIKYVKEKLTYDKKIKVAVGNHNASPGVSAEQKKLFTDPFTLYDAAVTHVEYPSTGETKQYDLIFINTNLQAVDIAKDLEKILRKCSSNFIYIIGHEPLIAAKLKNPVSQYIYLHSAGLILDVIFRSGKTNNIIYLCADVHNFQTLTLKDKDSHLSFPIIVSGTGGAEPDSDIFETTITDSKDIDIDGKTYNVTLHAKALPYGYCLINGKSIIYHTHNNPNSVLSANNVGDLTVSVINEEQTPIYVNPGEDCKFEKVLHPPPKKE